MSNKEIRKKGALRTAKCEKNKREAGLLPRKKWIHNSNEAELERVSKLMLEPNVTFELVTDSSK